jgi:probable phosphoglycerate mutase
VIVGRRLILEADGGSRGNPGPAAYGTVVRDAESGEVLFEEGATIGVDTNNVAEDRGLIAGLIAAKELEPSPHVEARLDSKLIVEQMSGRWKIKHENMRRLAMEAKGILPRGAVRYTWVPRSQNAAADRLVNLALDGEPVRRFRGREQADAADTDAEGERAPNALVGWSATHPDVTTTVLLRHGETVHTAHKRFSGWGGDDPGLSDTGRHQAELVASHLKTSVSIDAIVTSPMARTRETADVIASALGLDVAVEDDVRECSFGEWDGLTFAEVQERSPDELAKWLAATDIPPPGGESFAEVADRVAAARRRLMEGYPNKTVLVVTHVTPLKTLISQAIDAPAHAVFRMHVNPASLSNVQWFGDGHASVNSFNETMHLR